MYKQVEGAGKMIIPSDHTRNRKEFDFDQDNKLNLQEFMASNAVLNTALAKSIIEVFDGFGSGIKVGIIIIFLF